MSDDIESAIRENAQRPARVSSDAGTVVQHSLPDQIEADKYLATKDAVQKRQRGLRFNKFVPPGVT
jgi:hypothetical protein